MTFIKEIITKGNKIGDTVRISKCKNIFAKGYTPNLSEEMFWSKKLKTLCCGHILLVILAVKNSWKVLQKIIAKNK